MNHTAIAGLETWLSQQIIGQADLVKKLLIAILADGHLLVEGAPGLAKTRAIKMMAAGVEGDFHRVQFTPDLLTALFLVMATQNPIEQEGTYPLPEAQLDRFLMHVKVDYPNSEAERGILKLARREASTGEQVDQPEVSEAVIFAAREEVLKLHMSDAVEEYIVQLIMATRQPAAYSEELASWIEYGASPRATIGLDRCARAHAWLLGKDFVSPDDVKAMAYDVLRHRLVVSYDGEIAGVTADDVIDKLLDLVPVA